MASKIALSGFHTFIHIIKKSVFPAAYIPNQLLHIPNRRQSCFSFQGRAIPASVATSRGGHFPGNHPLHIKPCQPLRAPLQTALPVGAASNIPRGLLRTNCSLVSCGLGSVLNYRFHPTASSPPHRITRWLRWLRVSQTRSCKGLARDIRARGLPNWTKKWPKGHICV